MTALPLQAILFWIAVTLAPHDTSQILVTGPDATWAWTRQTSDWSFATDRSVWAAEGDKVTTSAKERDEKKATDVGQFVRGVKEQDWTKSAKLILEPKASLAKEGKTYVYTLGEGTAATKQYAIRFRSK
jgi:hypothetical protein